MNKPAKVNRAGGKRATLPGASELFRPTQSPESPQPQSTSAASAPAPEPDPTPAPKARSGRLTASGRVKHDQKITVYFSSEELFALEDAVIELRRRHGITLDRGRLVRTAVALAIHDLAEHGAESAVVAELTQP
ncbi:MAG: cobyrinic acid a,c-diamide synthase [Propionibacteriaceae bacterium]|nr:cobyrinic acid a,c-diamide synthase [Propionibacteriaceae bacterium]